MNANDIQMVAHGAHSIGPTFWIWGLAILAQTALFSIIGTWAVSRFVDRVIEKLQGRIDAAVKALTEADSKVSKETGDSVAAMRQHVQNVEREIEKRFHAVEKKALEDKAHYLEFFMRRESFRNEFDKFSADVKDQFKAMADKIDEIRDRKAA